jgi:hypothetical protein
MARSQVVGNVGMYFAAYRLSQKVSVTVLWPGRLRRAGGEFRAGNATFFFRHDGRDQGTSL